MVGMTCIVGCKPERFAEIIVPPPLATSDKSSAPPLHLKKHNYCSTGACLQIEWNTLIDSLVFFLWRRQNFYVTLYDTVISYDLGAYFTSPLMVKERNSLQHTVLACMKAKRGGYNYSKLKRGFINLSSASSPSGNSIGKSLFLVHRRDLLKPI